MSEEATSALHAAARRYADAGVYVFPVKIYVRGDGKKGVAPIPDWDENSSIDPAQIDRWWGPGGIYPERAIAIDCGRSGIVGIDQDVSEGKDGIAVWAEVGEESPWRVRSGSGGIHDYFRADPEHPFTVDNDGTIGDGVDVRYMGGFLFAPPSIDPRGGSWEWIDGEPDWEKLPLVPRIVIERMESKPKKAGSKKKAEGTVGQTAAQSSLFAAPPQSSLFAPPDDDRDFGPEGGYKTREDALALLSREHQEFVALTEEGSARSHRLSQRFGVLAGRGVDVFWTYEWALDALMSACRENGFADANGEGYARGQAERGLEHGMRERWIAVEPPPGPAEVMERAIEAAPMDAIDALIGEMLSLDDMESAPPPKFMIHKFLQFDSESWVIGAPGSKKSFVVFDMAARVVRGEPWQGYRTNPADVVFIVAEGASGHGKRVKAWQKRYGKVEAGSRQAVFTLPRPVQARDTDKWAVLVGACRKLGQRAAEAGRGLMVVLDTQARVTVGLKENDNGEMNQFVEAVSAIRRATGACVVTIHHTKKGGGDARGASVIDGAQTTELKIESDSGKLTARLKTEKQKDIDEHEPISLAFEVVEVGVDSEGEKVTSLVMAEAGSVAFAAAWSGSEVSVEDVDADRAVTPLTYRTAFDPWIVAREPRAKWHHRIVQVLVDTAGTLGLTQPEVRKIVKEKYGDADNKTWGRAWQAITDEGGSWTDVITSAGGQRWTVDRLRVSELLSSDS